MKAIYLSFTHTIEMVNDKEIEDGKVLCLFTINNNNIFRLKHILIWRDEWENQGGE